MSERINNEALKRLALKEEPRFLSILLKDKELLMDCMAYGIKGGPDGHFWHEEPRFLFGIISSYYNKFGAILTRTAMESIMGAMEKIGNREVTDDDRTNVRMYWDKIFTMESDSEDYQLLRDHINNRYVQCQAYEILKNKIDELVKSTSGQIELVKGYS
jgi:hypothetical protein